MSGVIVEGGRSGLTATNWKETTVEVEFMADLLVRPLISRTAGKTEDTKVSGPRDSCVHLKVRQSPVHTTDGTFLPLHLGGGSRPDLCSSRGDLGVGSLPSLRIANVSGLRDKIHETCLLEGTRSV